jgi:hypothetical protein
LLPRPGNDASISSPDLRKDCFAGTEFAGYRVVRIDPDRGRAERRFGAFWGAGVLMTGLSFPRVGLAVLLVGVAVCGLAGRERECRQGLGVCGQSEAVPGFLLAWIGENG